MKKLTTLGIALSALLFIGCDDAQMASKNLSKKADNFQIERRIVFLNGITDKYILSIHGYCSLEDRQHKLAVICKTENGYKKHQLGLSDNVTYFSEQISDKPVSVYHYEVTFKPQVIIPNINFHGSVKELAKAVTPD